MIFVFREFSAFSPNDRALLSSFANQSAIAVQNAQLYAQVEFDRKRVTALLDSAADGILILTSDLTIERANQAFSFQLGLPVDEIISKNHDEIIRWAKKPHDMTLPEAVAGGWPLTPNATLYVEGDLIKQGSVTPLPVGITYAPLLDSDSVLLNIITTIRDITRFRQADEMKTTFISVVSHELKTPVALIKGYVGTLRREDARWDRKIVDESLQVIEEEADRLAIYIENLLDATRLQANSFSLKRTDIQLATVIERVAERLQTQTSTHQIVSNVEPDLPVIVADEIRINQLISNLVSNSIKYAPKGKIEISAETHGDNIVVCVSDEGSGISPSDAPFVFDRFYRSPDATKQTKGAGLGLYLAKAIVESHGGRIWIDPEKGKGACVCFSLPIGEKEQ